MNRLIDSDIATQCVPYDVFWLTWNFPNPMMISSLCDKQYPLSVVKRSEKCVSASVCVCVCACRRANALRRKRDLLWDEFGPLHRREPEQVRAPTCCKKPPPKNLTHLNGIQGCLCTQYDTSSQRDTVNFREVSISVEVHHQWSVNVTMLCKYLAVISYLSIFQLFIKAQGSVLYICPEQINNPPKKNRKMWYYVTKPLSYFHWTLWPTLLLYFNSGQNGVFCEVVRDVKKLTITDFNR